MENPPLSDDNTWIQEFQLKNRISTPPLYEEFEQHCSRQSSQSPTLIQATWANEFQQINSDGEEQLAFQRAFEEVADEGNLIIPSLAKTFLQKNLLRFTRL